MKTKNLAFLPALIIALFTSLSCAHADLAQNKKVVVDFYDLAFNKFQAKKAAELYLTEEYIQHNPFVATGRKAFIDAFAGDTDDGSKAVFVRTIAEDDLVVLHSHKFRSATDVRGVAGIDIFRVKDGKITEHWDVNQAVPETAKNNNTMF